MQLEENWTFQVSTLAFTSPNIREDVRMERYSGESVDYEKRESQVVVTILELPSVPVKRYWILGFQVEMIIIKFLEKKKRTHPLWHNWNVRISILKFYFLCCLMNRINRTGIELSDYWWNSKWFPISIISILGSGSIIHFGERIRAQNIRLFSLHSAFLFLRLHSSRHRFCANQKNRGYLRRKSPILCEFYGQDKMWN